MSFDRFSHYDPDDWITYSYSQYVTSIDFSNNYVYFATMGGGILRYNIWDEEWASPLTTSTGLRSNRVKKVIYSQDTHELFAITEKGIDLYLESFGYFQPYPFSFPLSTKADSITTFDISFPVYSRPDINQWPNMIIQIGYTFMLDGTIYNDDNEEYKVTDKIVDSWNRLWFGTTGTGIGKADLGSQNIDFIKRSVTTTNIKDVFVSGDDIWFGGEGYYKYDTRGISCWDYNYDKWAYYRSGINYNIPSDNVYVIEGDKRYVFFGTGEGLLIYDLQYQTWKSLRTVFPMKQYRITDLNIMGGNLYIANTNGVFQYNIKGKNAVQIAKSYINQTKVNSLASSDSLLYIATNFGLFEYNADIEATTWVEIKAAISGNFIDALAVREEQLWVSADDGLAVYNISTKNWKSFPALSYSLKTKINHINFTDNYVWFATNGGLLRYSPKNEYWYLYTKDDGLVSNNVNRIDVDGDYLWLSTDDGVTLFAWNKDGRKE